MPGLRARCKLARFDHVHFTKRFNQIRAVCSVVVCSDRIVSLRQSHRVGSVRHMHRFGAGEEKVPILGIFEHKEERPLVMDGAMLRGRNFVND